MTSVSMALNHYSILVDGQSANPGTLNKWLRNNGGYVDGDDLDEKDVMKLSERIDYIGAFYGMGQLCMQLIVYSLYCIGRHGWDRLLIPGCCTMLCQFLLTWLLLGT